MTALLLLAAGQSRRFGAPDKLLADWEGVPLVLRTARSVSHGWTGDRLAVTSSGRVQTLLEGEGWTCLHNPAPEAGQAGSLKLGVSQMEDAFIICLADMPHVTAAHIAAVDAAGDCVMSRVGGTLMPPAKFGPEHRAALLSLSGDAGAKSVFLAQAGQALDMPAYMAADVDAPSDLPQ